jgi:hypothetical protein
VFAVALVGCGGGGGGGGGNNPSPSSGYTAGVFDAESKFANQCAVPRSGTDPTTGKAFLDTQGSVTTENNWLRSWSHDLYLWYTEMPDINPSTMTTATYFAALKTSATTLSGAPKDKFHFTYKTSDWVQLSQSGVQVGYGLEWFLIASRPPRNVVVAFTDPAMPAGNAAAQLARGAQVLTADGVDVVNDNTNAGVNTINAAFFPSAAGSHTFVVRDVGSATTRMVTLQASQVTETPVQNAHVIDAGGVKVGYMLFNDHIATAEQGLIDAINTLKNGQATELVLDIRYNGGGYLAIASELAYMIAGPARTAGQTFDKIAFNAQHPTTDPVTGEALAPTPFLTSTNFANTSTPLPTLNLNRVFVLTSPDTCSASEAVMNGLNGVDVQVIQIGSTTCGKPYGFYPQDNCGTTYFTIEFKGINAKGFGDYTDGFTPQNSSIAAAKLPGCSVADDFNHALGDPQESRLASALAYLGGAGCPAASGGIAPPGQFKPNFSDVNSTEPGMVKPPWRTNRIY